MRKKAISFRDRTEINSINSAGYSGGASHPNKDGSRRNGNVFQGIAGVAAYAGGRDFATAGKSFAINTTTASLDNLFAKLTRRPGSPPYRPPSRPSSPLPDTPCPARPVALHPDGNWVVEVRGIRALSTIPRAGFAKEIRASEGSSPPPTATISVPLVFLFFF